MNPESGTAPPDSSQRLRIVIRGAVQGVGFRPFVFRLASELGLCGWVNNSAQGVVIEVEGGRAALESFLGRVNLERPPRSYLQSLEPSWLDPVGFKTFEIRESAIGGPNKTLVLPDIGTCPECLGEIFDPANRRYFYPFTNCTNCGPRFSIIKALPYDRANTTMRDFTMCPQCQAEYENPSDRRFHAQPNACPLCGPQLEFRDRHGTHTHVSALQAAAEAIRSGKIVAAKGLGGFHLLTPARDEGAVCRLRERKHREEKPLALMFPSLELVRECCLISAAEERLLRSPEAPIVLLRRADREDGQATKAIAPSVAPGNPYLGVMLPYTPMHHLLLSLLRFPVVATSGNLSDEPICIDEHDARERLKGIADAYLVHNRPIARHVDDSIVRLIAGREMMLRRARGYAPLPVSPGTIPAEAAPILAVGAHLKNAIAVSSGPDIFVSQHIGDLETDEAYEAFRRVVSDLKTLYEVEPAVVAADAHPDYLSSKFAREQTRAGRGGTSGGVELFSVQHHLAHVLSCMAENALRPPLLGVAWDGTGYGLDGTVWGGEFFVVADTSWARFGHLRQFPLPGGDQAIKEPRRSALGLLFAAFGERAFASDELPPLKNFSPAELGTLKTMLQRKVNSPLTSSAGRVFDAVSSLAGLRQQVRFEGQAAMELEFAVEGVRTDEAYPIELSPPNRLAAPWIVDWAPLLDAVLGDLRRGVRLGLICARFHNALVEAIVMVARQAGHSPVALSGGCFQNRYLTERAIRRLEEEGFRPYWHQRVPPNDGGIALGQVLAAIRR